VVPLFHRHRILTQVAADNMNVIKLLPPLVAGEAEVDAFVAALDEVLESAGRGSGLLFDLGRTMARGALPGGPRRSRRRHSVPATQSNGSGQPSQAFAPVSAETHEPDQPDATRQADKPDEPMTTVASRA
jgi:hypothetical protein